MRKEIGHTHGKAGDSVIDYILVDEEMRKKIYYVKIEDAIDSDHSSIDSLTEGR